MGPVGHASVSTVVGGGVWAATGSLEAGALTLGGWRSHGRRPHLRLLPDVYPEKARQVLRAFSRLGIFHNWHRSAGIGIFPPTIPGYGGGSPESRNY